ncbi:hypothetical protein SCA6_005124 [Theobroma cacao]
MPLSACSSSHCLRLMVNLCLVHKRCKVYGLRRFLSASEIRSRISVLIGNNFVRYYLLPTYNWIHALISLGRLSEDTAVQKSEIKRD